jgi:hypothetical protein
MMSLWENVKVVCCGVVCLILLKQSVAKAGLAKIFSFLH